MKFLKIIAIALVVVAFGSVNALGKKAPAAPVEQKPAAPEVRYGQYCDGGYHSDEEIRAMVNKQEGDLGQPGDVNRR